MAEADPASELGQLTAVVRFVFRGALADGADRLHEVDRQDLDAEPFQELGLVDDRRPEEIDPLAELADLHRLQRLDDAGRPDERSTPSRKAASSGRQLLM